MVLLCLQVMAWLREVLAEVNMATCSPDRITSSVGLRNWPLDVDLSFQGDGQNVLGVNIPAGARTSNSAGKLLLENDAPEDEVQVGRVGLG